MDIANIQIQVAEHSFSIGNYLKIIFSSAYDLENYDLECNIIKIDNDYDLSCMLTHSKIKKENNEYLTEIISTKDLPRGFYYFNLFIVKNNDNNRVKYKIECEKELTLFYIYNTGDEGLAQVDIINEINRIYKNRDLNFLKGLGNGENEYVIFLFLRNCLITRRMRIEQLEVQPFEGLECNDYLNLIQKYLEKINIKKIEKINVPNEFCKSQQPTFVIYYPIVKADNHQGSYNYAKKEADLLINILTYNRQSYAEIFGAYIFEKNTTKSYFKINTPIYSGNLLGGDLSGEDPSELKLQYLAIKNNQKIALFVSLYCDVKKEENIEFRYFKLWNILETISKSKNYSGNLKLDRTGQKVLDENGNSQNIGSGAEELVFELIRIVFDAKRISTDFFKKKIDQGNVFDQIPIWYCHRNCAAHDGGCFPNNSKYCNKKKNYKLCRKAHDEIITKRGNRNLDTDEYLNGLDETVRIIIDAELFNKY